MRARPPPDGGPSRAVSGSVHGLYARMRARAVSVCMMEASTCQAQARAVFSIHGANVTEASATADEHDMENSQLPEISWRRARLAKQLFSRAPLTAKARGNRSSALTTQTRCCGDAVVRWASRPDLPAKYGSSRLPLRHHVPKGRHEVSLQHHAVQGIAAGGCGCPQGAHEEAAAWHSRVGA